MSFPPHVTLATGAATSLNFPPAHAVQALAPAAIKYVPAAQLAQTISDTPPVTVPNFPTPQPVHALAPACALYVPAPHSVHAEAPLPLYLPAPQDAHAAAETAPAVEEKVPPAHAVHALARVELYPPAAQATQALAPRFAEYLPASHGEHVDDPEYPSAVEYKPTPQS
jgi:hypothetical protein